METEYRKTRQMHIGAVETSADAILPDYQGDVKKVLSVTAHAVPAGQFAADGEVRFAGTVEYEMLYADAEGKLTCATASADYEFSCPTEATAFLGAEADVRVANLSFRLSGPRKFLLKSTLGGNVTVTEKCAFTTGGTAFEGENPPQILEKTLPVRSVYIGIGTDRTYEDEGARLEDNEGQETQVLSAEGAVRIDEIRAVSDGVTVDGAVVLSALLQSGERPPFRIRKEIPFEERISVEGATPDMCPTADGYCASVRAQVEEEADGAAVVRLSATAEFVAEAQANAPVLLAVDGYMQDAETEAVYSDFPYDEWICAESGVFTVSGEMPRAGSDLSDAREIFWANAKIRMKSAEIAEGGVTLNGESAFCVIGATVEDDGSARYGNAKFTAEFSQNVKLSCQIPDDARVEYRVRPLYCEGNLDTDTVYAKCFVQYTVAVLREHHVRRMESCRQTGAPIGDKPASVLTVYYPEAGETLWSVAKKFRTTAAAVAAENGLSEATFASADVALGGVEKLIL